MQNKLQELTDKLYNEGLAKGKQEGEEMIAKAKLEASSIVAKANEEAKSIIAQAKKEAEELKTKVNSDIKMSSVQTISAIKQQIEEGIIKNAVSEPIKMALDDKSFVQDIISEAIRSFDPKSATAVSLDVLLPASKKGDIDVFLKNTISKLFGGGFEVKFDKNLTSGFKIGPKDGSYFLSFSDQDFEALFSEYLRPATRKIIFGK